jgi:hypothetical protein
MADIEKSVVQPEAKQTKFVEFEGGVYQTDFTPSKGNALQACIATILKLELEKVPNFIAQTEDIYDSLRKFLASYGLGFMKIMLEDGNLPFAPGGDRTICLLAGDSPRGSHRHVVVAELAQGSTKPAPIFDPHPSAHYLNSHTWVGLFVALVPSITNVKLTV